MVRLAPSVHIGGGGHFLQGEHFHFIIYVFKIKVLL